MTAGRDLSPRMLAAGGALRGPDLVVQQFAFPRVQGVVMANSTGRDAERGEAVPREAGRELPQLLGRPGITALCMCFSAV